MRLVVHEPCVTAVWVQGEGGGGHHRWIVPALGAPFAWTNVFPMLPNNHPRRQSHTGGGGGGAPEGGKRGKSHGTMGVCDWNVAKLNRLNPA